MNAALVVLAALASLQALLPPTAQAQAAAPVRSPACEQAMQAYQTMKSRATMDESQYAATPEGSAVRGACGPNTLADLDNTALNPLRPRVTQPGAATPAPLPSAPVVTPSTSVPATAGSGQVLRIISPTARPAPTSVTPARQASR